MQTKGTFPKTIESAEYDFVLIQGYKDEAEKLKAENEKLKQALQDQVDYHHFIGNSDCPITANEAFIYLYKNAKTALIETKSWQYGK
jgi:hypothetical protein